MADNVLPAVVDAIAEEDNDLGGLLLTRLRVATEFGRDNGQTDAGAPTVLTSPADVFVSGDAGRYIDILLPLSGVPTGNEGSYVVSAVTDSKNVVLVKIDGSAPTFVTQKPVRWRFASIPVESTLGFPANDRNMEVWIGDEPTACPYGQLDKTPSAQRILGLGGQTVILDGILDVAAPTTLTTIADRWSASDVGKTVYICEKDSPTGNEGPQLITALIDGKNVTVSPGGLVTETEVSLRVKTYAGDGYMTDRTPRGGVYTASFHRELAEVYEGSGSYSAMDRLRRAMLTAYATEEELDRIGSNLAVARPLGVVDETYRCLLETLAYLPRATVYALELVLACFYPSGGWQVYEDLINFPNTVFILTPEMAGTTAVSEGKTFFAPNGVPGSTPVTGGREAAVSTDATHVDAAEDPTMVVDVKLEDVDESLEMAVLPSADTPAWTFNTEGAGTPAEGAVFSVSGSTLTQVVPGAPSQDGGNYSRVEAKMDQHVGSITRIDGWFQVTDETLVADRPFFARISHNNGVDREVYLRWQMDEAALTDNANAIPSGAPAAAVLNLAADVWYRFRLEVLVTERGDFVRAHIANKDLFGWVDLSPFDATAANEFAFGYEDQGSNQNFAIDWDRVRTVVHQERNYYNRLSTCTPTGGGSANIVDSSNPFVAGDVGKLVRLFGYDRTGRAFEPRNSVLAKISAYVGASTVTTTGVTHGPSGDIVTSGVTVGSGEGAIIEIAAGDAETFRLEDGPLQLDEFSGAGPSYDPVAGGSGDGKSIVISGSTAGNDGTYKVLEVIDQRRIRVDNAGGFTTESGLTWAWATTVLQATPTDYEVVEQGSHTGVTITLGDALPSATENVELWYTTVLSAQVLLNEFVQNLASAGSAPNVYYPVYLFDVDRAIRQIVDEVTAAGVIPQYEREF